MDLFHKYTIITSDLSSFKYKIANLFLQMAFSLTIVFAFFSYKYAINNTFSYITGEYKDFTTVLLYLSDIFLFLFFISFMFLPTRNKELSSSRASTLLWILITLTVSSFIYNVILSTNRDGFNILLGAYYLTIVVKGVLLAILIEKLKISLLNNFLYSIVAAGFIAAIFSIVQFFIQRNIGLPIFGESRLSLSSFGIATIWSSGYEYLRSYSTLPHPNVAGVALSISFASSAFVLLSNYLKNYSKVYSFLLISGVILLGSLFSFSRSAYLSILLTLAFLLFACIKYSLGGYLKHFFFVTLAVIVIFFATFQSLLLPRALNSYQSNNERASLNKTGIGLSIANPLFGTGPGQSLLHMEHSKPNKFEPWEIQPVHNLFIQAAVELGGLFSILLFICLTYAIYSVYKKIVNQNSVPFRIELSHLFLLLLCIILVTGLFDHFYFTLNPGIIIFWSIIGLSFRIARE